MKIGQNMIKIGENVQIRVKLGENIKKDCLKRVVKRIDSGVHSHAEKSGELIIPK